MGAGLTVCLSNSPYIIDNQSTTPTVSGADPIYTYDLNGNRITMTDNDSTHELI